MDVSHTPLIYRMLFATEKKEEEKTASVHQKKGVRYTLVKSPFTANPNLKPQNGALWCSRTACSCKDKRYETHPRACYYPPHQKGLEMEGEK